MTIARPPTFGSGRVCDSVGPMDDPAREAGAERFGQPLGGPLGAAPGQPDLSPTAHPDGSAGSDLPDLAIPEPGHTLAAVSVRTTSDADLVEVLVRLREAGAEVVTVNSFPATKGEPGVTRVFDIEIRDLDAHTAAHVAGRVPGVHLAEARPTLGQIFGKRVIVIGGGAQVAQVTLGAVSESDRHNLRGERISVDTIALVGEREIAAAVRAVADLPRAHILVLAGSIMGGEITDAVRELQAVGIPVVSLNMVGSVASVADLVVSDPVQAGTMAVMAIADTARFSLDRLHHRRY
jgi:energy-converting hydrogenase B subunit Q